MQVIKVKYGYDLHRAAALILFLSSGCLLLGGWEEAMVLKYVYYTWERTANFGVNEDSTTYGVVNLDDAEADDRCL